MQRPLVAIGAAAAALLAVLIVRSFSSGEASGETAASPGKGPAAAPFGRPVRPTKPPGPNDPHPTVREPKSPAVDDAWKAEMTAKLRGSERPGEAAFNAYSDRYVDENLELAQEQARAEGLTLPEVRALTRLGLLVMATQRTPDVEEVLGRELSIETRNQLEDMVHRENGNFKEQMRALVAKKAPEEERWELIRAADERFRSEFFKISGMTAEQLDDMLAGNLLLPGAPGANPDPSTVAPSAPGSAAEPGPKDSAVPPDRPVGSPGK